MKTLLTIFLSVLFLSKGFADDTKYVEAMKKNIDALYHSASIEDYRKAVNTFERIGAAEKSKWEPYYYASFGYIMMANLETDATKKDSYLDQSLNALGKAKEITGNESEIVALEGFTHMIRITVDPASRGQQYSSMAFQSFSKAVELNPENPRALALLAQMQFGMAQFFGSPTDEACGTVAKALEKFDTFTSENPLAPTWGRSMTDGLETKCQKPDKDSLDVK